MNNYSKPVSILLIGPSYPFRGGIAHYTTLLYRNLIKSHSVAFFSFKRQYPGFLFPGKTDKDTSRQPIGAEEIEYILNPLNPQTWIKMLRKVKCYKPQLIIFQWWVVFWGPIFSTIAFVAKRITKAKILFICHNVFEHEDLPIKRFLSKIFLSVGDYYIVHSEKDMLNLKEIIPGASVKKILHPTYDVFNFDNISREEAREKLKVSGDILLFFGFIRKYKGLEYLLEAMPKILKNVNASLLIVGEFWHGKEECLDLINKLGISDKVTIIDLYIPNEEVELYFKAADLVVLPYVSGTGSGIAQMALGFEKAIIATDAGCLPEVVQDGKTGYVVERRDSDAIADAVIRFLENQKSGEFQKNIKEDSQRFSWDNMTLEIERLLDLKERNEA